MTFHNVNCDKLDRTFPKICSNLSTEWLDARLNHPFEKYARQTGSFPQGRGENWKIQYVKPPSKFEFTSNFWVLFLFATPLSRQSGSKVFSLCWFHPEKSPKILNPASKYQDHLPNPHFSGANCLLNFRDVSFSPTYTRHGRVIFSLSAHEVVTGLEIESCRGVVVFLKREGWAFRFFWGLGGHFFRKVPYNHHMFLSFFHLLGLAVWGSLIHRNVTGWFPPEKNLINKAPKRSLGSKSPLVNLHHVSYLLIEEKKSHLESHWWKDLCKKGASLGYHRTRSGTTKVWVPSPGRGKKISAASVVHQSCCNGSGVSRFLGCVLLTPPWSLCLARKSMEVVSTCKHGAQ